MNRDFIRRGAAILLMGVGMLGCERSVSAPPSAPTAAPRGSALSNLASVASSAPKIRAGVDQVCELYPAANTVQCQKMWNFGDGAHGGNDFGQYVASYTDSHIRDLVTGPYNVCVLLDTGNTKCWGEGAPAIEYTDGDAVSVSLSRGSACVVTTAGTVKCRSTVGAFGIYHSTLDTWTVEYGQSGVDPTKTHPIPYTGKAQWIVSGGQFHCFQTDANPNPSTLSCIGSSYSHQQGADDDNEYARYTFNGTPVPVSASTGYGVCILMQEGNVDCLPIEYNDNHVSGPVSGPKHAGNVGATDLSSQGGATCALIPGGNIECWGSGFNYEFVVGYNSPYTLTGRNAVAVAKPGSDLCWLDSAGSVRCLQTGHSAVLATAPVAVQAATTTTVSFGSGPFTYTGNKFEATATVSPAGAGSATITYDGDCINAGSTCRAQATFAGNSAYGPSSSEWVSITIDKAPTTTTVSFGPGPFIYSGNAFTATTAVNPSGAGDATIAYSGECTYAGTCTATATYAGNSNYVGSNATASITIKYPVATTSEQCKNGGWQRRTDDVGNLFKNQGDCVSFVATKGKNKGSGGI